eukprot:Gb_16645 [translate_table: standard]
MAVIQQLWVVGQLRLSAWNSIFTSCISARLALELLCHLLSQTCRIGIFSQYWKLHLLSKLVNIFQDLIIQRIICYR